MTISFVGHSSVFSENIIKATVKEQIRNNVATCDSVTCYLGGYGDFDKICALVCKELKEEYVDFELVYVTPYISLSAQEKIKEMKCHGLCDTSIYPPIDNVPPKFAILKRNEWMITNADLVIAYVNRNYGGAYESLQIAKRRHKKIINIYNLIV